MLEVKLTDEERALLRELARRISYASVWSIMDARAYRTLEGFGLVRIGRAPDAPKDGAKAQPYFGVKLTAAGRAALTQPEAPDHG